MGWVNLWERADDFSSLLQRIRHELHDRLPNADSFAVSHETSWGTSVMIDAVFADDGGPANFTVSLHEPDLKIMGGDEDIEELLRSYGGERQLHVLIGDEQLHDAYLALSYTTTGGTRENLAEMHPNTYEHTLYAEGLLDLLGFTHRRSHHTLYVDPEQPGGDTLEAQVALYRALRAGKNRFTLDSAGPSGTFSYSLQHFEEGLERVVEWNAFRNGRDAWEEELLRTGEHIYGILGEDPLSVQQWHVDAVESLRG